MNYFNMLPDNFSLDSISDKMLLKSNVIDFNHSAHDKSNKTMKPNKIDIFYKLNSEASKMECNKMEGSKMECSKMEGSKTEDSKELTNNKKADSKFSVRDRKFFYPKEKDTLFWCYYINKYGIDKYFDNKKRSFVVEHDYKISIIEKIQNMKDELKLNKIKKLVVEDELMNKAKIEIASIKLLMLLDNENLLLIKKNCYQKIVFNRDKLSLSVDNYNVIFCDVDNYYLQKNLNDRELVDIIDKSYEIDNFDKPLKGVSSYKLDELHEICKKLNIGLSSNLGKNKTKQVLYTEILEKFI